MMDAAGIPTPKWRLLDYGPPMMWTPWRQTLPMPCVIKTTGGGSSLGVYLPEDRTQLPRGAGGGAAATAARCWRRSESYGRELTVAVLGDRWLPAVETVPAGKEFDYEAKYQAGGAVETCPAHITPEAMQRAMGSWPCGSTGRWGWRSIPGRTMILDDEGQPVGAWRPTPCRA